MHEDPFLPEHVFIIKCTKTSFTRPRRIVNHGHARNVHAVNRVDLRIKALIALEEEDPEHPFFLYNDTALNSKTLVFRQSGSVVSVSL